MKLLKKKLIGAGCLIFLLIPNIASAEEKDILNKTIQSVITLSADTNKDYQFDFNILVCDVKKEDDFQNFIKSIDKLNKFSKQKLEQYKIVLTDKDIMDYPGYSNNNKDVTGVISYKKEEIIIHNFEYDNDETNCVLYHELGHAIDSYDYYDGYNFIKCGKYSETDYFKEIFKEEGYSLKKFTDEVYFYDKDSESFAETFSIYLSKPNILKTYAPKLYEYMDSIYNQEIKTGWNKAYKAENYCYVGEDGKLKKGWFTDPISNKSYYFNKKGVMQKATIVDGVALCPNGEALY